MHFITFPLIYSLWWLCFRYFIVVQNEHWNVIIISFKFFHCKIKLRVAVWKTSSIRLSIYISHSFIILKSYLCSSLEEFIITGAKPMCTLFLKLSTPILNTLKMNVFFLDRFKVGWQGSLLRLISTYWNWTKSKTCVWMRSV